MMTCTAETSIDIDFQIIEIKESRLNDLIIISFRFSFHIPDFTMDLHPGHPIEVGPLFLVLGHKISTALIFAE